MPIENTLEFSDALRQAYPRRPVSGYVKGPHGQGINSHDDPAKWLPCVGGMRNDGEEQRFIRGIRQVFNFFFVRQPARKISFAGLLKTFFHKLLNNVRVNGRSSCCLTVFSNIVSAPS